VTNRLRHIILLLGFVFLQQGDVSAAHIVGGDIYYDYLGNNNYRFYISIYRDCNTITGAPFDSPMPLGIFFTNTNIRHSDINVSFPGSTVLPIIFNNPCVVTPTGVCTERAIYISSIVNLPPVNGGYTIAYQRCCRQPAIINILNAAGTGLTLVTKIPGLETGNWANSSPRFTNYPPLVICNNDDLVFNHSATDPDGDVLTYSLVTPFAGASSGNPAPIPIPAPAYPFVQWETNHSVTQQLGPGSLLQINPTTGVLTASPNLTGLYVVGIRVDEYRNGVLIGGNTRDFLFKVINCVITLQAILPLQTALPSFSGYCDGLTVDFVNNSYGATSYAWDFGVPGITTDVSTATTPSYTYPLPGTYTVQLVANPGSPCTDTAYMTVVLDITFNVDFTATDSICFEGHSIDFAGTANAPLVPTNTTYSWDFGTNASIATANTQNVNNVVFNQPGVYPVTLYGVRNLCNADTTINVLVYPTPISDFALPDDYECLGQTISFTNNSASSSAYMWNFGDPTTLADTSNLASPTYTYPSAGTYTAQLIAGSSGICMDTIEYTFQIYEDLIMSVAHQDSLCVTGNSIDFVGTVSGPSITQYSWDFGSTGNPSSGVGTTVNNVVFTNQGNHPIVFTGSYLQCSQDVTSNVFLYGEPSINFGIEPGLQCAPFMAQFIDLSISDTPFDYLWDFGDGTGSTLANPSHVFENPGVYPISLQVATTAGCIATLNMTQNQLVNVRPRPVSSFTTSTDKTDICNPEVIFYDQSSGASKISYWVNDGNIFASDVPAVFPYLYQSSGYKTVQQIVLNEYGCEDTSFRQLLIEPFTIFIPNAFTPDADQFNNEWKPEVALEASEWHLVIYDRWGERIWESYDQNAGWDGFYNGFKAAQGIYGYKVEVTACGKEEKYQTLTGHFSLLK
jgi:gliding motility-associated-like protein